MDDLGFVTDNPTSAESIKASHETLRLTARKAQHTFGSGFMNVGYLSACLRDDYAFRRRAIYELKSRWAPIFEPDAAQMSGIGDAALKINQAVPGYFDKDNIEKLTGIINAEPEEIFDTSNEEAETETGEDVNGRYCSGTLKVGFSVVRGTTVIQFVSGGGGLPFVIE